MKTQRCQFPLASPHATLVVFTMFLATIPAALFAQGKKKNPVSKVYFADVSGEAQIDTGEDIKDLEKRSVYTAQGTVIETKKAERPEDKDKIYSTMVYSNGTGAFFDADTRVEVRKFVQEPFTPNRSDVEVEPSISQTQAFVARGTVGLCTSKLVAGSSMAYQTPHGSVNIRGKKVVIEAEKDVTTVSMLEGDSTVRAGTMDMGGHTIHAGEQAVIRQGGPGEPNLIQISRIPDSKAHSLDDKVSMACLAKKTVYFEARDHLTEGGGKKGNGPDGAGDSADGSDDGGVTVFDDKGSGGKGSFRDIIPVQVVPTTLPVQYTVTPTRPNPSPSPRLPGT